MENRTDICVIVWKLCEYVKRNGEKQFCFILVLLQRMTFIWDGRNPLSVTGSYLQETWHAHHVKRTSSLSKRVNKQLVHLFVGWWNADTYWDWSESCSIVHNGGSSLQLQNWLQHQTLPLFIFWTDQCTNVPMWHLTHDVIEIMPFFLKGIVIIFYSQTIYIPPVLIRVNSNYYLVM